MQSYELVLSNRFKKEFRKLDRYTQKLIRSWIDANLTDCTDPRLKGKKLSSNRADQWSYRIGDYRLICMIQDNELVILALSIGHRREIYR